MLLRKNIVKSNVPEKNPNLPLSQSNTLNFKQLNINGKEAYGQALGSLDTFTVLLVGLILAVCISIASEGTIDTLPTGTLELGL